MSGMMPDLTAPPVYSREILEEFVERNHRALIKSFPLPPVPICPVCKVELERGKPCGICGQAIRWIGIWADP